MLIRFCRIAVLAAFTTAIGYASMAPLPAQAQRIMKVRDANGEVVRKPKAANAPTGQPASGAPPSASDAAPHPAQVSPAPNEAVCIAGCVAKR